MTGEGGGYGTRMSVKSNDGGGGGYGTRISVKRGVMVQECHKNTYLTFLLGVIVQECSYSPSFLVCCFFLFPRPVK